MRTTVARDSSGSGIFALRRVLADAERAFVVSPEDARQLIDEGFRPERVGDELHPNKTILVVPAERAERLTSRIEMPVRLGVPLLAARQSCMRSSMVCQ